MFLTAFLLVSSHIYAWFFPWPTFPLPQNKPSMLMVIYSSYNDSTSMPMIVACWNTAICLGQKHDWYHTALLLLKVTTIKTLDSWCPARLRLFQPVTVNTLKQTEKTDGKSHMTLPFKNQIVFIAVLGSWVSSSRLSHAVLLYAANILISSFT